MQDIYSTALYFIGATCLILATFDGYHGQKNT